MTTVVKIPLRYFDENPLDSVTDEDLSDMPTGLRFFMDKKVVEVTDNKVRWRKRPRRRFVQVYSVQFLSDEPDQIYGTIELHRNLVFNRDIGQDNHHHAIDKHGFVRLIGPNSPLRVSGYIEIHPKVYRGNQPDDFFNPVRGVEYYDVELGLLIPYDDIPVLDRPGIDGVCLSFPIYDTRPVDELIYKDAEITCGTMRVEYAIFTDAADSYLTIKLLEWNGQGSAANVCGRIFASNTRLDDKRAKSLVFDRNRDEENLFVITGQYIPLQRPMNVVSMGHELELDFDIFHKNMGDEDGDDLPILREKFYTEAKCYTEESGVNGITECHKIGGKHCKFELNIYWLPY